MKTMTSAFAAALIASASFASVALAEGDYYDGVSKTAAMVDHVRTDSIAQAGQQNANETAPALNRGDYYDGANRPN